ncbi:AAA family ATPase [Archangium violaceum]|uniref:spore photoproduct lyase family protein n=1 Tax=Archangium violaceum TaxID=83451 RepID=UPI00193B58DF|nr:AAA family ATPase [Archangium violaceum]QRK12293.1 AAA family ATPase [Archangium violaceum]
MKTQERKTAFIRRFAGPGDGSGIVCFKFWQLVPAMGCPFRCSYCFLQDQLYFRFNPETLAGLVYTNIADMVGEVEKWLEDPIPKMLIVGELQDGLVFDPAYKKVNGTSLTHLLVPLFAAQTRHRLIFLTKATTIENALELPPTPQVVFSWSVNAEYIGTTFEHGAPPPSERFEAARRMKEAGWPIRFRLDPMVPYPGWQEGYAEAIERINALEPEMVTLGSLRATSPKSLRSAAEKNGRDASIFDYLGEERDASGFKYRVPEEVQLEMFRFALDRLAPRVVPALCKEDAGLWRRLGLPFRGCHCLLGGQDALVDGAAEQVAVETDVLPVPSTLPLPGPELHLLPPGVTNPGEWPLADASAVPDSSGQERGEVNHSPAEGTACSHAQLPPGPSDDGSAAVASAAMDQSVPEEMPSISIGDSGACEEGQHATQAPELVLEAAAEPNPHEVSAPGGGQQEDVVGHRDLQVSRRAGGPRRGLKSWTAAEVARTTPAEVRWIARPWVAEGAITIVDGKPKLAGKSTWVAHLVKHVLTGSEFLDELTTRSPVVLLTEERPVTLRRLLERVGIADSIDLHVIFYQDVRHLPWDALVKQAVDKCREVGAKLLIIDTLAQFSGIPESSSGKALDAVRPLQAAAEQGLGIVAVRHERKSGGGVGDSGRGSSALTGAVDIIVALQRPPNHTGQVRILHALSRYEETPSTLTIELGDEGYSVREGLDIEAQDLERALLLAVPDTEEDAKTADELMDKTGLKKTKAREALARMVKEGKLLQTGTGRKGAPYRYWRLATS